MEFHRAIYDVGAGSESRTRGGGGILGNVGGAFAFLDHDGNMAINPRGAQAFSDEPTAINMRRIVSKFLYSFTCHGGSSRAVPV